MPVAGELAELRRLTDAHSRTAFLNCREDLLRPAVVEQIAEAVRQHVRVDIHEALHLAEAGVVIAERIQHSDSQALASRAKANALYMLGQNQPAVELHDVAIQLFKQSGNEAELGRSLSASLQPLCLLGQYDRAFDHADRARQIFARQGDSLRLARLDINIGNILHRQDRFQEALDCYRRALDELWPDKDVEGVAVVLHNMAVCLIGLNEFRKATDTYGQAREFCDSHAMPLLVLQADYNIAALYHQRGEYGRAMRRLLETRAVCQTIGDEHHQALCQLDLSDIYLELNLTDEAGVVAAEAFERFEKLSMGYEAAKCMANRAVSLGRQHRYAEALQLFTRAREMFVSQQNRAWPFLIDLYQAMLYADTGRLQDASELCQGALMYFCESAIPTKAVLCEILLARIAWATSDWEEASRLCRAGLQRAIDLDITSLKHQAHALLGHILEKQERLPEAWDAYRSAHLETEVLRSALGSEEMKIAFMANKFDVYERLVALSIAGAAPPAVAARASSVELAFEFIEEGKSRALRDIVLGRRHTAEVEAAESVTGRRTRELRQELNWYRHQLEQLELGRSKASASRLRELQEQVRIREKEFQRVLREDPSGETSLATRVATIEEVRNGLPADSCLVEYYCLEERLVAILVSRESLEWVQLGEIAAISTPLRLLRFQFQMLRVAGNDSSRAAASLAVANDHLRTLHGHLVAPLLHHLSGYRNLVIVPHDVLHSIPFQALFDGEKYLIDSFGISYAPSASVLSLGSESLATGRSLILGVPDERAPRIEDEVKDISSLLPDSEVYVGERATVNVLREIGAASRYVHIASHGHFRPDSPMFSGVRLGDEYLDVYDLYQLHLPCELVTLSGCGTGLNVLAKGDELLGLERGLLFAGAKCVLLTMWDIHDASTALLMPLFYQALQQHGDKVEALRHAQQSIRSSFPHPYHWAAFVLAGNPFCRPASKVSQPVYQTGDELDFRSRG